MSPRDEPADNARCSACGAEFVCGVEDPEGCWCARLPAVPSDGLVSGAGCLCERCLLARIASASGPAIADPAVQ
ncbi:MAG TPA: cysteine-rich CWC family protein [Burkholderiaceae bacterium]|nr:cysteine-rich CWC family protein [Burkholderiaceae bacterium]